jgi:zinc transport system substrate-binding protein
LLSKQLTEKGQTMKDPHVWLNPQLAKNEVRRITDGYISIDPTNTMFYQENEKALDDKLDQLDSEYKEGLANCQNKDIITSHAAFAYLAEQYGLNQVAISGLSPDEEPSAQQLADVANFARKNNVRYIFFESLVSPKLSETIASEIGAKTMVLDPIEGLSDDDIKQGKNYFTVMEDNLKNLQTALQCSK